MEQNASENKSNSSGPSPFIQTYFHGTKADLKIGDFIDIGINSNFVNFTNAQEIQTATASQTVFTLTTMQYQPGTGSLSVFVDGVNQYGPGAQYAYTETSATVVTFVNGLHVGASVKFTTSAINASSYGTAADISYTPAGTGAVATNVQAKLRQTVSTSDFGAVGDGTTDDTTAIQAAINAAVLSNSDLFVNPGTYKITSTLTITNTSIKIYGAGRYATTFDSFVSGSVILCSQWGGVLDAFGIYINNATGNGIEAGNLSRNCVISNIYIQVRNAYTASATGAGIYLNTFSDTGGFSGGLEIRTTYVLGFKYGVRLRGATPVGENTWTTVAMYNLWVIGRSTGVVTGSAGIYMNAGTNDIGTCLYGGTIEGFNYGIYVEDNSYGGVFETDMEANTIPYSLGNAFSGRVVSAFGVPAINQAVDGAGGVAWYKNQCLTGAGPISETYYQTKQVLTSGNGDNVAWTTYHNASLIDGNAVGTYGLKFQVGVGQGSSAGAATHPSQHYIQLGNSKLHWGNDIPSARTGAQLVTWSQGDICYNLSASVGAPKGWVCTVAGTPGTWVSMGNL